MPNWVITQIFIAGPEDKIKEFEDKVIRPNEEEVFSFNSITKRPEELDNTKSPPPNPIKSRVKNQLGEEFDIVEIDDCNNATPKMCRDLELKFGHNNWYAWNNHNWGTKWDASESVYKQEDRILEFKTAWACPVEILKKMREMFPALDFVGNYADEDFGSNVGYFRNGSIHAFDNSCEAYETAASLWGIEGYYDDEKKAWVFEGDDD